MATDKGNYVSVNGLNMYYEVHGAGPSREGLVLLHGAFSAIGTSFGKLLPSLAQTRQVIAFEMQAHGRTADIDRPLFMEQMADDGAAALRQLRIERADIFGYSMGSRRRLTGRDPAPRRGAQACARFVPLQRERRPPRIMEGMADVKPEQMVGSPWHEEYMRIAPNPEAFATFFPKKTEMDRRIQDLPDEAIQSISAPTLLIIGDSDLVRPEHAVEMFRLLGGGVFGDMAGMPNSQLAILPGTSHVTVVDRADWLVSMIPQFLDAPMPEVK